MDSVQKTKSKKSLFTCFKPTVGVNDTFSRSRKRSITQNDPVLAYLAVADEEGIADGKDCQKKKGRDRWRTLRAALIGTSLMKRIVNKKKANKGNGSLSRSISGFLLGEEASCDKSISNSKHMTTKRIDYSNASTFAPSSALTSPSSSLSSSCSSRADHVSNSSVNEIQSSISSIASNGIGVITKQIKQNSVEENKKRNCYGSIMAVLCILCISLLVLLIWGKFLAIVSTTTLFYLMPLRRRRLWRHVAVLRGESEFDSVKYKKKVVMEGLLHRNHSRVSLASCSNSNS